MSQARRLKSRTGCLQCKRRKVKCDESLPACNQCLRQKLPCPGYKKPLKWIDAPEDSSSVWSQPIDKLHSTGSGVSGINQKDVRSAFRVWVSNTESPSLSQQLNDESSALIHHYFTRLCRIAGCFDSDLSPFRILSTSMMAYSKPVLLLLQASSAAQLSRQHPRMRVKALSLQTEAFSAVRTEIGNLKGPVVSDELMISCIIAGLTSAWYDVNDLGLSHVLGSQVLLSLWLMGQRSRLKYQQTFILGTCVYWIMISAFVAGDPWESFHYQEDLQQHIQSLEMSHDIVDDMDVPENLRRILPHPLTGFSMQLCVSVGKIGSLCRLRYVGANELNGEKFQDFLEGKAQSLESELLDLVPSLQSNFADPQDPQTTVEEILSVGEAYRCAGLLQLYATFPQLLPQYAQYPPCNRGKNLYQEIEKMELTFSGEFTSWQYNWLRALASHILKILETIPATSGTRVLQGLPCLIAATWLVDPIVKTSPDLIDCLCRPFEHPRLPLRKSSYSKEYWRGVVRAGLRMHNEYVSLQQVSRVLEIVEEVWRLDDLGDKKCHWMVVVASKGLQTLYG